jgi:O-antigen/teichoic acid export membrane protein
MPSPPEHALSGKQMTPPTPDQTADTNEASSVAPIETRSLITRGLVWNSAFQIFLVGISFVSMLVLVRLVSPAEYGRAAAVTGILALINCLNCGAFIAQALQLPSNETPDWSAHWRAGFCIQTLLCLLCNAVGGLAWLSPAYRPIAPVLHVASIGLLIDVPSQVANIRLRRAMNFRTLRIVHASATTLSVVSSIGLAFSGAGAYALIISSNVLHGLPFGFYLLAVERWRPEENWWSWPDWNSYRPSLRFGAQQTGSAVLAAARGVLETVVIPPFLGYEALGLLNRAQVLFTTTIGRATSLVIETVYPMLPQSATDPKQFARHATLFVQTMLLLSVPGAVFVGIEGPQLSRLLYGAKWIAADPLIWPGTIFAWGVATVLVFTVVIQAQNRLRKAFLCSVIAAALCLPATVVVLGGGGLWPYAWALAIGQTLAAICAMALGSMSLLIGWVRKVVFPPIMSSALAAGALFSLRYATNHLAVHGRLVAETIVFAVVVLLTMRIAFTKELGEVICRVPARGRLMKVLRLQ